MLNAPRSSGDGATPRELESLPEQGARPYFHHGPVERIHARVARALFRILHRRAAVMVAHVIVSAAAAAALMAALVIVCRWMLDRTALSRAEESMVSAIAQWRTTELVDVAQDVSALGGSVPAAIIVLAFCVILWMRRWRYSAGALIVTLAGGMFLNFLLKFPFDRPRPLAMVENAQVHTMSFPSGHALVATIAYGGMAWIAARMTPQRNIRIAYYTAALVIIVSVSAGRLYLGTHFVTDMLAGWVAGIIWIVTILAGIGVLGVVKGSG